MRGSPVPIPHSALPGGRAQAPPNSSSPLAGLTLAEDASDSLSAPKGGEGRGEVAPSAIPHSALRTPNLPAPLNLVYSSPGVWLYHNNCLAVLDAIAARYPEGRFDCIFADPPYFLSNGGITCHAGKMVSVHKGDWDQSRGPD